MNQPARNTRKRNERPHLVGNRTRDVFIFLFFVFVCSIFWFVQQLEENFSYEITTPVTLTDIPKDVVITTDVPSEIKLTVRGKGIDLLPYLLFNKSTDTLRLSVSTFAGPEMYGRAYLLSQQIQRLAKDLLPSHASILAVNPDTLSFYYNRGLPRRLPIRPAGYISAKDQYCIVGCRFSPDSVNVYAPKNVLDTMRAVYTELVNQTSLDQTIETRVRLAQKPGICTRPEEVSMTTIVDILTGQSKEVPIVGVNFPADKTLRTFPPTVKVLYRVPGNMAGSIKLEDFTVVISYAELEGNATNRCRPHINQIPEGVVGAYIDPVEVEYLIENIQSEDSSEPTGKQSDHKKKQR